MHIEEMADQAAPLNVREHDGLDRAQFLRRAGGGIALVAGGSVLASVTPAFAQSAPSPNSDLDILQTAFLAESLAVTVYGAALNLKYSKSNSSRGIRKGQRFFTGANRTYLQAARQNEIDHRNFLRDALGANAPKADASKYRIPKSATSSPAGTLKFALTLETAFVSTYLGAVPVLSSNDLKLVAAKVAANEASHQGFFSFASGQGKTKGNGGRGVTKSLPDDITLAQATKALGPILGL